MQNIGRFQLVEASGLSPAVFAGTIIGLDLTGQRVDFKAGTEAGEQARLELAGVLQPLQITWLDLQHGAQVVYLDGLAQPPGSPVPPPSPDPTVPPKPPGLVAGDAALLVKPGRAAAFTTADCVPLVISDGRCAVAIHAGWRGIAEGVVEAGLKALLQTGRSQPSRLRAWIGPAIDQANYEVDDALRDSLLSRASVAAVDLDVAAGCFTPSRPGHWLADLPGLTEQLLASAGLPRSGITTTGLSTYQRAELHSARRDGNASGRMATIAFLVDA